jgi:hypothetical protein
MTRRIAIAAIALSTAAPLPALAETRTYDVGNFEGIDVSAGIEVIFETGTAKSVSVENKDGDFSDIIVESKGGELVLKRPRKMGWGRRRAPYTVTVGAPSLSSIEASSGSSVSGDGLSGPRANVEVSSGADVEIGGIDAETVIAQASSGASMEIAGTCTSIDADASSGATLDAGDLICERLTADVSSGASIEAHASRSVRADASSGGSVKAFGGASDVSAEKSSGGSVRVVS